MSQMVSVQGQVMPTRLVNATDEPALEYACCRSKRVQFRQCRLSQFTQLCQSLYLQFATFSLDCRNSHNFAQSRLPQFPQVWSVGTEQTCSLISFIHSILPIYIYNIYIYSLVQSQLPLFKQFSSIHTAAGHIVQFSSDCRNSNIAVQSPLLTFK